MDASPSRSDKDSSVLSSKVNDLLRRIKLLENKKLDIESSVKAVLLSTWFKVLITRLINEVDGGLLPIHNHSFLVSPGTSDIVFSVDGDGGFIYRFSTMKLKVKIDLTTSSRVWFAWNTAINDWSEIGDNFSVTL
jgi:hypothetical protein